MDKSLDGMDHEHDGIEDSSSVIGAVDSVIRVVAEEKETVDTSTGL
jgi:hypothetical protein